MERPRRYRRPGRVREKAPAEYEAKPPHAGLSGVLLDSDVIIRALRGYPDTVAAIGALESSGVPTYTCAVAWAEVYAGMRRGEEPSALAFLRARGEVVIDSRTGRVAGDYLARHGKSHGLGLADAIVAAAASTSALHLWTLNRKHFPMRDVRFFTPE